MWKIGSSEIMIKKHNTTKPMGYISYLSNILMRRSCVRVRVSGSESEWEARLTWDQNIRSIFCVILFPNLVSSRRFRNNAGHVSPKMVLILFFLKIKLKNDPSWLKKKVRRARVRQPTSDYSTNFIYAPQSIKFPH